MDCTWPRDFHFWPEIFFDPEIFTYCIKSILSKLAFNFAWSSIFSDACQMHCHIYDPGLDFQYHNIMPKMVHKRVYVCQDIFNTECIDIWCVVHPVMYQRPVHILWIISMCHILQINIFIGLRWRWFGLPLNLIIYAHCISISTVHIQKYMFMFDWYCFSNA